MSFLYAQQAFPVLAKFETALQLALVACQHRLWDSGNSFESSLTEPVQPGSHSVVNPLAFPPLGNKSRLLQNFEVARHLILGLLQGIDDFADAEVSSCATKQRHNAQSRRFAQGLKQKGKVLDSVCTVHNVCILKHT